MSFRGLGLLGMVSLGCGGGAADAVPRRVMATEAPAAPVPQARSTAQPPGRTAKPRPEVETRAHAPELPGACEDGATKYCFPPLSFVEALCRGKYPGVALVMFRKSEPWQHAFVKVRHVAPVNHYRGPRSHVPLAFSEEVILLRHRPYVPRDGIDVRAPDNFDVLRLSGTCATLAEDELRTNWYGPSTYAPLLWTRLDAGLQDALAQSTRVDRARRAQSDGCSGSNIGGGDACQRATDELVRAIMLEVNAGLALPRPEAMPEWGPESTAAAADR